MYVLRKGIERSDIEVSINVGHISEIYRFPVKSFAGERLESCIIEHYGMRGDRVCSFYDETKTDWFKYITARNIPNMLNYQARFVDGASRLQALTGVATVGTRICPPNCKARRRPL
ncbi:MOSC N-terminal beta barrel domain-containing protein [Paenibacillus lycopersici]|uniref:MOSC N-terminal beta barrel domain-containing protein n=1 Tax=Paenibacillus lycopersici TaxID=2704462 RepID=UPI00384D75DB